MRKIILDHLIYNSGWIDAIELLQPHERGELLNKIIDYLVFEHDVTEEDLKTNARFIWPSLKQFIKHWLLDSGMLPEEEKRLISELADFLHSKGGEPECRTEY